MNNWPINKTVNTQALWLILGEFVSRGIAFGAVVWLANYLGSEQYGMLSSSLAVANIIVIVADFGLSSYVIKELARDHTQTQRYISEVLGVKIILSALAIFILLVISYIIPNLPRIILVIAGSSIILANGRMFIEAYFRAHQRMYLEAFTKIVSSVLLAALTIMFIVQQASLNTVAIVYLVASLFNFIFALGVLRWKISTFAFVWSGKIFMRTVKFAWPFGVSIAFNYLLNYMDMALLGIWGFTKEAGWYGAAYKPIFFFTALAGMIINAYFPLISKQYKSFPERIQTTVHLLFKTNMLVAVPLAIGGTVLAPWIFGFLYTPEYQPAIMAFQILLWSTVFIFFWASFGNSLQACDQERTYMRGFGWAALINTLLNLILIPYYSLYGAAVATLLTQVFLAIFMYTHFKRFILTIVPNAKTARD